MDTRTPTQTVYALAAAALTGDDDARTDLLDSVGARDPLAVDPDGLYDPDLYPAFAVVRAAVVAIDAEVADDDASFATVQLLVSPRPAATAVIEAARLYRRLGPLPADELLVAEAADHGVGWLLDGVAGALEVTLEVLAAVAYDDPLARARSRCLAIASRR